MRKLLVIAVVLVFALAGMWLADRLMEPPLPGPPVSSPIASAPPAASAEARGLPTLAPTLRRVMPAVVSITVQARQPGEDNPLYKDPFFRPYFGDQIPPERQVLAAGSGVVIDTERGLVLTNNHVVRNSERIGVALSDGRRIEAKLVGSDPPTDLALLSIAAQGLVGLTLDDSDKLEIGDYVVAIGNPFGLGQTVTFGVIPATWSAKSPSSSRGLARSAAASSASRSKTTLARCPRHSRQKIRLARWWLRLPSAQPPKRPVCGEGTLSSPSMAARSSAPASCAPGSASYRSVRLSSSKSCGTATASS